MSERESFDGMSERESFDGMSERESLDVAVAVPLRLPLPLRLLVIPAKAGIQRLYARHPHEGRAFQQTNV